MGLQGPPPPLRGYNDLSEKNHILILIEVWGFFPHDSLSPLRHTRQTLLLFEKLYKVRKLKSGGHQFLRLPVSPVLRRRDH